MITKNLALLYGKQLSQNENVTKIRCSGTTSLKYPFTIDDIEKIIDDINIFHFEDKTFRLQNIRETKDDIFDWRVEECSLLQRDDDSNEIYTLYPYEPIPLYTLIIFNSTIHEDFTGGEHVYFDGKTEKPSIGNYIFFDAREPYRINPVISGTKLYTKVIFY